MPDLASARLPAVADDLYGLPLDEFTPARNELAKELKKAGDAEEAERIKGLKKPSAPAWIVNQLVRRKKKETKALLRAGDGLRSAQEKALGGGGRSPLEKAIAAERQAVEQLVAAAREVAESGGVKASDANLARVQSTLHAVSLDDDVRERFEAGELIEDHEATGVDTLALMAAPARKREGGRSKRNGAAERKRLRDAEGAVRRAEDELEAAQRELNAAKERVKQLEGRLARARKSVERLGGS